MFRPYLFLQASITVQHPSSSHTFHYRLMFPISRMSITVLTAFLLTIDFISFFFHSKVNYCLFLVLCSIEAVICTTEGQEVQPRLRLGLCLWRPRSITVSEFIASRALVKFRIISEYFRSSFVLLIHSLAQNWWFTSKLVEVSEKPS